MFFIKVPAYQKNRTDNPRQETITDDPFEDFDHWGLKEYSITEDHKKDTITEKSKKDPITEKPKENITEDAKEDFVIEDPQGFQDPQCLLCCKKLFLAFAL